MLLRGSAVSSFRIVWRRHNDVSSICTFLYQYWSQQYSRFPVIGHRMAWDDLMILTLHLFPRKLTILSLSLACWLAVYFTRNYELPPILSRLSALTFPYSCCACCSCLLLIDLHKPIWTSFVAMFLWKRNPVGLVGWCVRCCLCLLEGFTWTRRGHWSASMAMHAGALPLEVPQRKNQLRSIFRAKAAK